MDPLLALAPMSPRNALIAAILVVVLVIIIWKFIKGAFKIAIVVGVAVLIYLGLNQAGII
jgi:hypothetical protein